MLRVLEVIGKVVAYAAVAALVALIALADLWVLFRYGFFVWMFVLPIALSLVWFVFAVGLMAVSALVMGLVALVRRLLGTEPAG